VRAIIDEPGVAVFTQSVSGFVSMLLPGGPPIKLLILPTWIIGGVVVDLLFQLAGPSHRSRVFYGLTGSLYIVPGDFLLYWSFSIFLNWSWPLLFFIYGFVFIHILLGGLTGLLIPNLIERIKPVIGCPVELSQ